MNKIDFHLGPINRFPTVPTVDFYFQNKSNDQKFDERELELQDYDCYDTDTLEFDRNLSDMSEDYWVDDSEGESNDVHEDIIPN